MSNPPLDSDLVTGSEPMDGEHRLQVGLLGALGDAVAAGRPADAVDEVFDRLLEFTKVHFASEELLMRLYAYDGYAAHVLEHEAALERIEDIRDQYRTGKTDLTLAMVEALGRWIATHTRRADRTLATFLGDAGIAGRAGAPSAPASPPHDPAGKSATRRS